MTQGLAVKRLALIGCGLMGGSFALALRHALQHSLRHALRHELWPSPQTHRATDEGAGSVAQAPLQVAGYSRSRSSAERAQQLGIIDDVCATAADAVRGADVVLVAVPVTATLAVLQEIAPHLRPDALVMDVGSTKRDVVQAAREALEHLPENARENAPENAQEPLRSRLHQFVPAHPIAGKEHGGIEQAEADLYEQRTCILTPIPAQEREHADPAPFVGRARALWEAVGCRVVTMSPEDHDETFAAVSHLPHLLAFAYVNGLAQQPQAVRHLALAGPGFRDFSRIAGGTSAIWRDIFSANRDEVLAQLHHFEAALAQLRGALERADDDAVAQLVDQASAVRSGWRLNGLPLPGDDPT